MPDSEKEVKEQRDQVENFDFFPSISTSSYSGSNLHNLTQSWNSSKEEQERN